MISIQEKLWKKKACPRTGTTPNEDWTELKTYYLSKTPAVNENNYLTNIQQETDFCMKWRFFVPNKDLVDEIVTVFKGRRLSLYIYIYIYIYINKRRPTMRFVFSNLSILFLHKC